MDILPDQLRKRRVDEVLWCIFQFRAALPFLLHGMVSLSKVSLVIKVAVCSDLINKGLSEDKDGLEIQLQVRLVLRHLQRGQGMHL